MAKFYPAIDDRHAAFIAAQRMFFVATAPRHGRINVSPKGDGVFVNGKPVDDVRLGDNDEITVRGLKMKFMRGTPVA